MLQGWCVQSACKLKNAVACQTVDFRMFVQMANNKSQMVNGKGYNVIVWHQSVIVPTGAVVVRD